MVRRIAANGEKLPELAFLARRFAARERIKWCRGPRLERDSFFSCRLRRTGGFLVRLELKVGCWTVIGLKREGSGQGFGLREGERRVDLGLRFFGSHGKSMLYLVYDTAR